MVAEFWSGWFDHWGEKHHTMTTEKFVNLVSAIFRRGASINFYMFVGGTNFGFWNGANNQSDRQYAPTITSYDYDAPISECGDFTDKAHALRKVLEEFKLQPVDWPHIPDNPPKAAYSKVQMKEMITIDKLVGLIKEDKPKLKNVVPMEFLDINNHGGQGYGYILYRNTVQKGGILKINGNITDRAQLFINFKEFGTADWFQKGNWMNPEFKIPEVSNPSVLDILVENTGRVNYSRKKLLNSQRKGIIGDVLLDNVKLEDWIHIPIEFCDTFYTYMHNSNLWQPFKLVTMPAVYRGVLSLDKQPVDTFLSMSGWKKGIVFINGHNLGRYWTPLGPQQALYVPAPVLAQGKNEIIIFEQYTPEIDYVNFVDKPVLSK